MTVSLRVEATGPLSLVQDLGRPGLAGLGVPESGALDQGALALANRLVGNDEHLAGLETTLGGLALRVDEGVVLAVTGAPVTVTVTSNAHGRRTYGTGAAIYVPGGSTVAIEPPRVGLRSWVAVRGGLQATEVLGSASTDVLSGLGDPLEVGDELPLGPTPRRPVPPLDHAPQSSPTNDTLVLRAVPGPREDWFTEAARAALTSTWTIGSRSNRVGIRLEGEPLERSCDEELPSEGAVAGSVQVAANGLPVLFLADHPVTGGYPIIATVVSGDLPLAAQAVPGQQLCFRYVSGPRLPRGA